MPGQEASTHLLPPFVFSTEERLSWFVWFLYTCREITNYFAGCWNSGSSLHEVRLQPGCPGMGFSSAEPRGLWVHADLWTHAYFHQEKHLDQTQGILVPCSWHQYSLQALCLAVLPSPFLLTPITGLLILHLLPASGWSLIHIRDNHVWWTCSIRDREQRRAGTCQVPDEGILSINRSSKCHTMLCDIITSSGSHCWGGTQLRWPQHGAPSKSITLPVLFSTPVPPLQRQAHPESHCYRRMKGISQSHFSISEVWVFEMNLEACQLVFYAIINLLKNNNSTNSDEGGFLS